MNKETHSNPVTPSTTDSLLISPYLFQSCCSLSCLPNMTHIETLCSISWTINCGHCRRAGHFPGMFAGFLSSSSLLTAAFLWAASGPGSWFCACGVTVSLGHFSKMNSRQSHCGNLIKWNKMIFFPFRSDMSDCSCWTLMRVILTGFLCVCVQTWSVLPSHPCVVCRGPQEVTYCQSGRLGFNQQGHMLSQQ